MVKICNNFTTGWGKQGGGAEATRYLEMNSIDQLRHSKLLVYADVMIHHPVLMQLRDVLSVINKKQAKHINSAV